MTNKEENQPKKETELPESINGLPCDNPTCDYNEPDVPLSDYKNHIGRNCPKCDEPLLDQKTYDELVTLYEMLNVMKSMSAPKTDVEQKEENNEHPKGHNDFSM